MASPRKSTLVAGFCRAFGPGSLVALLAACGPSAASDGGGGGTLDLDAPYNNLSLGKPDTLPLAESVGASGTVDGAAYRVDLTAENVEQENTHARFRPNWASNTPMQARRLAAAFYFIDLNGQTDPQNLILNWLAEPAGDNLWVGLADWDENRWVWRKLADVATVDLPSSSRFRRTADGFLACVILVLGTENSVLGNFTVADQDVPPGSTNAGYPLGINLERLADWSRAQVYTDVFKLSRDWIPQNAGSSSPWDTGEAINTDSNGWVTSLAPGKSAMAILVYNQAGNYPAGRYVCRYDGDGGTNSDAFLVLGDGSIVPGSGSPGRFEIDITPKANSGTWFKIDKVNPANYIRNIRVIMPGFESTYDTTNVLHPSFVANLESFHILRFMDWGQTNNSPVISWADRIPGAYCRYTMEKGAPIEAMIELCNLTQKDMWFCIPHQADDNYVTEAATLIRDTLNPNLRLFLENSNEVWNWGFQQSTWSHNQGLLLWPGDSSAWLHYYGLRTAQMMDLAALVYAGQETRLVRVLASHAGSNSAALASLDQEITGPSDKAYHHVDMFAIAPYFGGSLGLPANEALAEQMTVDEVLDYCEADSLVINGPGGRTEIHFNNASARGLPMISYEGGQHLAGVGTVRENATITALFVAANRHPRMRQIYLDDLNRWTARGGNMYVPYMHTGQFDMYGSWGLLENQNQNLATSYKWLGVQDWLTIVLQ